MAVHAKQLDIDWHAAVVVATAVAGTLATDFEAGDTVNGVVLALQDRILIKDQVDPAENGLYTVNAAGAPTRAQDGVAGRLRSGASVFVSQGTVGASSAWWLTTIDPIVVGVTALTWARFTGEQTLASVLEQGDTTSAHNILVSDGDEVQLLDGALVARGILDFSANDVRLQTFDAAGNPAGLLTIDATATPELVWDGIMSVTGPSVNLVRTDPVFRVGTGGGSGVVGFAKNSGGAFDIIYHITDFAGANRRWIHNFNASSNINWSRRSVTGSAVDTPLSLNWTTGLVSLDGTVNTGGLRVPRFTDATRGAAGTSGRIIFNSDDGNLNIDDGTNWVLTGGSSVVDQGAIIQGVDTTSTNFHGTTDDQVIRFNGATTQIGAIAVATWLTVTDSATEGTTFTIIQPGSYWCSLYLPCASGSQVQLGITLNAPASVRQFSFNPTMVSVEDNAFNFSTGVESMNARATIVITQDMIDAGDNVIRAQAGDIADGPPNSGVFAVPADVNIRFRRVGEAAA